MSYIVSITSQGQISIPAKIRKQLKLDRMKKALLSVEDDKIVLEPVKDFLELGGVFKTDKKIPFEEIHESFGQYLADEATKGIK